LSLEVGLDLFEAEVWFVTGAIAEGLRVRGGGGGALFLKDFRGASFDFDNDFEALTSAELPCSGTFAPF